MTSVHKKFFLIYIVVCVYLGTTLSLKCTVKYSMIFTKNIFICIELCYKTILIDLCIGYSIILNCHQQTRFYVRIFWLRPDYSDYSNGGE